MRFAIESSEEESDDSLGFDDLDGTPVMLPRESVPVLRDVSMQLSSICSSSVVAEDPDDSSDGQIGVIVRPDVSTS